MTSSGSNPGAATASVTAGSPFVRVPVLSKSTALDRAHRLEGEAVGDEHAAARRALGRDRDDERDGEAERVGAGDHEHGDGAHDGVVGVAEQRPGDRRDHGGAEREPEQPAGGAVGEALRARARRLRPGDETLDAGERRVVADRGDAHADRGVGRDGAGDDVRRRGRGSPSWTRR